MLSTLKVVLRTLALYGIPSTSPLNLKLDVDVLSHHYSLTELCLTREIRQEKDIQERLEP